MVNLYYNVLDFMDKLYIVLAVIGFNLSMLEREIKKYYEIE